jgi:hypothetical protein
VPAPAICGDRVSLKAVIAFIALAAAGCCATAQDGPVTAESPAKAPGPISPKSESSDPSQPPALNVDQAVLEGGGSMLKVHFSLPPPKSTQWLPVDQKDTYVVDEATGEKFFVLNLVRIGPAAKVRLPKGGGSSFMVFDNRHEHLKPGARITVVIGALKQEHVTLAEEQ